MRITRREAEDALELPRVRAFLRVIRQGESSQEDRAYRMRFGGHGRPVAWFDDFARHPRVFEPTRNGQVSSAAGAYQITATTWDSIAPELGLFDFSPCAQDIAAVALVARRGALDAVLAGRLEEAVAACRQEWTSLPGAAENSGRYTMDKALRVYREYGGAVAREEQPAAPIEDRSTPAREEDAGRIINPEQEAPSMDPITIGLGLGLVKSLIDAFSPLARDKIAGALNKHTNDPAIGKQVADSLLDTARQLTGQADDVIAVAQVKSDPALLAKAETAALDALEKLAPLLDRIAAHDLKTWEAEEASRDAAGARGRADGENDVGPLIVRAVIGIVIGILVGLFAIMGIQTAMSAAHEPSTSMLTLVGPLIGAVFGSLGTIVAYRFGTTRNNSIKDITVEQLSRRR